MQATIEGDGYFLGLSSGQILSQFTTFIFMLL